MPSQVGLTSGTVHDLEEICRYLDRYAALEHADHLLDRLGEMFEGLAEFPLRGRFPKELADLRIVEYREVPVTPYRVIYRVSGHNVDVLVITDGRRDMQPSLERRLLQA